MSNERMTASGTSEEYLGVTEAARELGVDPSTLRRWVASGKLEARKIGKRWKIRRDSLGRTVELPERKVEKNEETRTNLASYVNELDHLLRSLGGDAKKLPGQMKIVIDDETVDEKSIHGGLLARIIAYALRKKAGEIHIEPVKNETRVRCRIDKRLTAVAAMPADVGRSVVSELLELGLLDNRRRHIPQRASFELKLKERKFDLSLFAAPSVDGTTLLIKIMDVDAIVAPLDKLGFTKRQLELYRKITGLPDGLVLFAGQPGEELSKTVYSTLAQINDDVRKFITGEDEILYNLSGITQLQADPSIGFGRGEMFKSVINLGPDVIYFPDIEDGRLAAGLCKQALSGRLVFSSIDARDGCQALLKLNDSGAANFVIGGCLRAIVTVRTFRRICPECKTSYQPPREELNLLPGSELVKKPVFHYGKGCGECGNIGYKGTSTTYDVLVPDVALQNALCQGKSREEIEAATVANGWIPWHESAMRLLLKGETTIEEILKNQ